MGAVALTEPQGPAVVLPVFEGPLDLLLFLVRENRVSIWDIPVATICDQYQAWLRAMDELDLAVAGEYLVYAAWLLAIKSRMLLPRRQRGEEDPRAELVERLLAYEKVKKQAAELLGLLSVRDGMWPVSIGFEGVSPENEVPLEDVDVAVLARAMREVVARFRREHPAGLVLPPLAYTVQEKMHELLRFLREQRTFPLLSHMLTRVDRLEAVTSFLAALELVFLQTACMHQRLPFGEVYLTLKSPTGGEEGVVRA